MDHINFLGDVLIQEAVRIVEQVPFTFEQNLASNILARPMRDAATNLAFRVILRIILSSLSKKHFPSMETARRRACVALAEFKLDEIVIRRRNAETIFKSKEDPPGSL